MMKTWRHSTTVCPVKSNSMDSVAWSDMVKEQTMFDSKSSVLRSRTCSIRRLPLWAGGKQLILATSSKSTSRTMVIPKWSLRHHLFCEQCRPPQRSQKSWVSKTWRSTTFWPSGWGSKIQLWTSNKRSPPLLILTTTCWLVAFIPNRADTKLNKNLSTIISRVLVIQTNLATKWSKSTRTINLIHTFQVTKTFSLFMIGSLKI